MSRGVNGQRRVQAVEARRSKIASVDVPGNQSGAFALCRRAQKDAGASRIAVARLEIGAIQFPSIGHYLGLYNTNGSHWWLACVSIAGLFNPSRDRGGFNVRDGVLFRCGPI